MTNSRAGIVLSLMALVVAFVGFFYRDLPRRGGVARGLGDRRAHRVSLPADPGWKCQRPLRRAGTCPMKAALKSTARP